MELEVECQPVFTGSTFYNVHVYSERSVKGEDLPLQQSMVVSYNFMDVPIVTVEIKQLPSPPPFPEGVVSSGSSSTPFP